MTFFLGFFLNEGPQFSFRKSAMYGMWLYFGFTCQAVDHDSFSAADLPVEVFIHLFSPAPIPGGTTSHYTTCLRRGVVITVCTTVSTLTIVGSLVRSPTCLEFQPVLTWPREQLSASKSAAITSALAGGDDKSTSSSSRSRPTSTQATQYGRVTPADALICPRGRVGRGLCGSYPNQAVLPSTAAV